MSKLRDQTWKEKKSPRIEKRQKENRKALLRSKSEHRNLSVRRENQIQS